VGDREFLSPSCFCEVKINIHNLKKGGKCKIICNYVTKQHTIFVTVNEGRNLP
jgi:hypothetical protein